MKKLALSSILILSVFAAIATAQQVKNFDLVNKLQLLNSNREDVSKLFSPDTFTIWHEGNRQTFFRIDENVVVDYSTGTCGDANFGESDWFLGPDVWNVAAGRVVRVTFEPKHYITLNELQIDLSEFRREQLYRGRKHPTVYFNKQDGLAIYVHGQIVMSIEIFPKSTNHNYLCSNKQVEAYFRNRKWGFQPQPKAFCLLANLPANVRNVELKKRGDTAVFDIVVSGDDPENDVLSFIYSVQTGKIAGVGSKVVWDLSEAKSGNHEIKIAVDDGSGPGGRWVSKVVTVD